jgi:hypothetical protein
MTTLTLLVWNQTGVSELVLSLPKKPNTPQPGDNLLPRLDGPDVPPARGRRFGRRFGGATYGPEEPRPRCAVSPDRSC